MVSVEFRGEQVDIEIDHLGLYDHDTNTQDIEWHFHGMTAEQISDLEVTQHEEDAIYLQIAQMSDEAFDDDVF